MAVLRLAEIGFNIFVNTAASADVEYFCAPCLGLPQPSKVDQAGKDILIPFFIFVGEASIVVVVGGVFVQ